MYDDVTVAFTVMIPAENNKEKIAKLVEMGWDNSFTREYCEVKGA